MKFSKDFFLQYSQKYDERYKENDEFVEKELKDWLSEYRYLTRDKFIKLGLWKSKRLKRHYENPENTDRFVREVTAFSFRTNDERKRIESLLGTNNGIKGVSWPVASVILHFAFPEKYSIMDFRVIWSLGWQQPKSYNCEFWQNYVSELQNLSKKFSLSLRTLDKALRYYSKENQNELNKKSFEQELQIFFTSAEEKGCLYVDIQSGDLHRRVGKYPSPEHQMPLCCWVMKKKMETGDEILQQPPKGQGASLVIRYRLSR